MMDYDVSQMPPIDAVEIVLLSDDVAAVHQNHQMPCVRVSGETAQSLAWLWRNLPFDGQMRCHNPPYGFRFYWQNTLILSASVCWGCNNILLVIDGQRRLAQFDAQHSFAQELLTIAQQLTTPLRHDPNQHSFERNV